MPLLRPSVCSRMAPLWIHWCPSIHGDEPLEENGFFGGIAQSYAEASSEFYSELAEVADELEIRSEQERLRLLEEGKLDLNVSFDDLGLPEPFPEPAPGR